MIELFFSKQYYQCVAEQQVRLIEKTHLIKQRTTFQNVQREIVLIQQKRRAKVETIRIAQKQKIEQIRIAKKQQEIEKIRAKIFVCKRCSAKFSNNIKFYQHIQNCYSRA